jgi:hypothetical protein
MILDNLQDIEPRPSVMTFARMMEVQLRKHDATKGGQNGGNGRTGWRQDPIEELWGHAREELYELDEAIMTDGEGIRVAEEAADLGNMAMMVMDRALQLPMADDPTPEVSPQRAQRTQR